MPANLSAMLRSLLKARQNASATELNLLREIARTLLRPSFCTAGSSRTASVGNPRTEEEDGVIFFPFSPAHWTARNRRKKRIKLAG